jgi:hypothetical protein
VCHLSGPRGKRTEWRHVCWSKQCTTDCYFFAGPQTWTVVFVEILTLCNVTNILFRLTLFFSFRMAKMVFWITGFKTCDVFFSCLNMNTAVLPLRHRRGVGVWVYYFCNLGARWGEWLRPRPGRFASGNDPVLMCRRLGGSHSGYPIRTFLFNNLPSYYNNKHPFLQLWSRYGFAYDRAKA